MQSIRDKLNTIQEIIHPSKQPDNKLIVLIIGAGNMGNLMTRVLKENGHEVVGVISEKGESAKRLAQNYKNEEVIAGKWDERDAIWGALSRKDINVNLIVITVPPNKVFACSEWSLGKCHTFTRGNPLSSMEAEKLCKLAESTGNLFLGRSERLFAPVHLKARDLLKIEDDGRIIEKKNEAKVVSIESNFSLVPEEAPWYLSARESGDITVAHSIFDMQVVADLICDPVRKTHSVLPDFAFATGDLREQSNPDSVLNICKATLCWSNITYTAITSYLSPLDPANPRYIKLLFSDGKELLITHETNKPGGSLKWMKNNGNKQVVEEIKVDEIDKDPFALQFEEAAKLIYSSKMSKETTRKQPMEDKDKVPSRCLFMNAVRDIFLMEKLRESAKAHGMKKICEFSARALSSLSKSESLTQEGLLSKQSI